MMATMSMISNFRWEFHVITILTLGAVAINCVTVVRALLTARSFEKGDMWVCRGVGNICIIKILYGIACISIILSCLKSWSVIDVFMGYWDHMPEVYHIRSYAYLGENYGVGMLGYAMITIIKSMSLCETATKIRDRRIRLDMVSENQRRDRRITERVVEDQDGEAVERREPE